MARIKVSLVCACCGSSFEHMHYCRNSREGASYEEWAKKNITICPSCYAVQKKSKKDAELEKYITGFSTNYQLPEITGVSGKQVEYAEKLRRNFIANELCCYKVSIPRFFQFSDAIKYEKLDESGRAKVLECAEKDGVAPEEWFAKYRAEKIKHDLNLPFTSTVRKIEAIFSESSAAKIIDALH